VAARVPVHRAKNGRAPWATPGLLHLFGPPPGHLRASGPGAGPGAGRRGARRGLSGGRPAWPEVYAYLREREQPTETYFEAWSDLKIDGNGKVKSLVFLSDMKHGQWAGALTLDQQAELIAGATGLSGRNIDYLRDLVMHLREDGVRDHAMETLLKMVEAREASGGSLGLGLIPDKRVARRSGTDA
jgi:hypothetical protein